MLTHSQYYDAAASKSPIRQGNTASPAATLLPPLTSLCRRRRCVLHSLAIIAGLGVANALRETCFTCLRSQVGLVSCSARAALMQSTATFDDLLLFGSLWIYSNRLKLYLAGRHHHHHQLSYILAYVDLQRIFGHRKETKTIQSGENSSRPNRSWSKLEMQGSFPTSIFMGNQRKINAGGSARSSPRPKNSISETIPRVRTLLSVYFLLTRVADSQSKPS